MSARHRRQRADDWDWWEPSYAPTGSGIVHDLSPGQPEREGPPVVLWVPDIERRHKWREHWVKGEPVSKPPKRMGY